MRSSTVGVFWVWILVSHYCERNLRMSLLARVEGVLPVPRPNKSVATEAGGAPEPNFAALSEPGRVNKVDAK